MRYRIIVSKQDFEGAMSPNICTKKKMNYIVIFKDGPYVLMGNGSAIRRDCEDWKQFLFGLILAIQSYNQELSFHLNVWLHNWGSSIVRGISYSIMNSTLEKNCLVAFTWMVTVKGFIRRLLKG